jgi:hypothetical protein
MKMRGGGIGDDGTANIVSFDNQNILIGIGEKVRLKSATSATAWTSGNGDIATVGTGGTVTGVTAGNVKITVNGESTPAASVVVVPDANVITVTNKGEWDSAFTAISSAEEGTAESPAAYILNIQGVFDVEGKTTANITGTAYKKVRLVGTGTVSLSSSGSIIRTAAKQTFIIDGPTLVGKSDNSRSVVYLNSQSSAELRSGVIRGNTTSSDGGGVYVNNGGTFTMNGGAISGNTTSSSNGGGGVYVGTAGTFTMNGGAISGNTASSIYGDGGGVYIIDSTFTMGGGEISGNTAINFGGGVYNTGGTFTMTGGTIYGSDESDDTLKNTAPDNQGAAVYIAIQTGSVNRENTINKYPQ